MVYDGAVKITLPYPPCANNFYTIARGRKIVSSGGRDWIARCLALACWFEVASVSGPVSVTMRSYRPRKAGDIDSPIKHCLDILTKAGAIADDKQIVELHVYRGDDKADPRVELEVLPA